MAAGKVSRLTSGRVYRRPSGRIMRNTDTCDGCECGDICQSSVMVNAFPEDDYWIVRGWTPWYLTTENELGGYPAFMDVTISDVLNGSAAACALDGLKITASYLDGSFHATDPEDPPEKWQCLNEITYCGYKNFETPFDAPKLDGSGDFTINNLYVYVRFAVYIIPDEEFNEDIAPCGRFAQFVFTEVTIYANVSESGGDLIFHGYANLAPTIGSDGVWVDGDFVVTPGPSNHSPYGSGSSASSGDGQCAYEFAEPFVSVGSIDPGDVPGDVADLIDKECLAYVKYRQVTLSCTAVTESDDTCRAGVCGGAFPVCCKQYKISLSPTDHSPVISVVNPVVLEWADGFWSGEVVLDKFCSPCIDTCWSSGTKIDVPEISVTTCETYETLLGSASTTSRFNGYDPAELLIYDSSTDPLGGYLGSVPVGQRWWIAETDWVFLTNSWAAADGNWYSKIYVLVKFDCDTGIWTVIKGMLIKSDDTTYSEGGGPFSNGSVTYTQSTGTGATGASPGSFDMISDESVSFFCGDIEDCWTDVSGISAGVLDNDCGDVADAECAAIESPGYMEIRCVIDEGTFEPSWKMTLILGGNYMIWQAVTSAGDSDDGYCPPADMDVPALVWELIHSDWDEDDLPDGVVSLLAMVTDICYGAGEGPPE